MCELWQSQIRDSSSDAVTMDVLTAMNRVTLDIVGLAGEDAAPPLSLNDSLSHVLSLRAGLNWNLPPLTPMLCCCCFFSS